MKQTAHNLLYTFMLKSFLLGTLVLGCLLLNVHLLADNNPDNTASSPPPVAKGSDTPSSVLPKTTPKAVTKTISPGTTSYNFPPILVRRTLSLRYRIYLGLSALAILMLGILICRMVSSQYQQKFGPEIGFWFFGLFGLFGGIAALFVAAAAVGCLYLHLASIVCTIVSGFCIGALLPTQFVTVRSWIIGPITRKHHQDVTL